MLETRMSCRSGICRPPVRSCTGQAVRLRDGRTKPILEGSIGSRPDGWRLPMAPTSTGSSSMPDAVRIWRGAAPPSPARPSASRRAMDSGAHPTDHRPAVGHPNIGTRTDVPTIRRMTTRPMPIRPVTRRRVPRASPTPFRTPRVILREGLVRPGTPHDNCHDVASRRTCRRAVRQPAVPVRKT
jgi:hypothetical protein